MIESDDFYATDTGQMITLICVDDDSDTAIFKIEGPDIEPQVIELIWKRLALLRSMQRSLVCETLSEVLAQLCDLEIVEEDNDEEEDEQEEEDRPWGVHWQPSDDAREEY